MKCSKCDQLGAEHKRLKQCHELASLNLQGVAPNIDQGRFMTLKTLVDEARIDLELVETEIMRHFSAGHAVAN